MFQITLQKARIIRGYSIDEVSKRCRISRNIYEKYENDPGSMPASIAYKIRMLFDIPLDLLEL